MSKEQLLNGFPVKRMLVHELTAAPYNPRRITDEQLTALGKSIAEFGLVEPIIYNKQTKHVVGGHQRIAALIAQGETETDVVIVDLPEAKEKALNVALNKISGEWDNDKLSDLLRELQDVGEIEWTGFSQEELADLLAPPIIEGLTDPDEIPEDVETRCKPGDLWQLGEHRLLCGDSTKKEVFERLCVKTFDVVFDPEWDDDIKTVTGKNNTLVFCDCSNFGENIKNFGIPIYVFIWDCVTTWYIPNRPLKGCKLCLWYGNISEYKMNGAHYGDSGDERRNVNNSRGSYIYKPDPRGKHLSDLFRLSIAMFHSESEHNHSKPIDWMRLLIGNCTSGDIYDPFLGSGTTIVACEQLNRKCYGVEINPHYCDVIINRWESFTGKEARLLP